MQIEPTTATSRDGAGSQRDPNASPRRYRGEPPRNPGATDEILRLRKDHAAFFLYLTDLIGTDRLAFDRAVTLMAHHTAAWRQYLASAVALLPIYPAGWLDVTRLSVLERRYHEIRDAIGLIAVPPIPALPGVT